MDLLMTICSGNVLDMATLQEDMPLKKKKKKKKKTVHCSQTAMLNDDE